MVTAIVSLGDAALAGVLVLGTLAFIWGPGRWFAGGEPGQRRNRPSREPYIDLAAERDAFVAARDRAEERRVA